LPRNLAPDARAKRPIVAKRLLHLLNRLPIMSGPMSQKLVQLAVVVVAALFEVGGDGLISEAIPSSTWLGPSIVIMGS
jgi:hypothetical protein